MTKSFMSNCQFSVIMMNLLWQYKKIKNFKNESIIFYLKANLKYFNTAKISKIFNFSGNFKNFLFVKYCFCRIGVQK